MLKDKIIQLVEQVASDLGYLIYEASVFFSKNKTKIFVKIDNSKVISHEDCQIYSQELGARLKIIDFSLDYLLEISSPGLNRKLKKIEDFNRFKQAPVKIVYGQPERTEVIKGTLLGLTGDKIKIDVQGTKKKISYSEVINANLDY